MLNLNMELLDHYIGSLKIFWEKCDFELQTGKQKPSLNPYVIQDFNCFVEDG